MGWKRIGLMRRPDAGGEARIFFPLSEKMGKNRKRLKNVPVSVSKLL